MNLDEAHQFLTTKRPSRGRPPKEWTLQKEEAKKVIAAASKQSTQVESLITKTNSTEEIAVREIKLRDPCVAEATDALIAVSNVEW